MKILIIGASAAGMKAAARLSRDLKDVSLKLISESASVSGDGLGLPYYLGGEVSDIAGLSAKAPAGVEVTAGVTAVSIDPSAKIVNFRLPDGSAASEGYDKLIIAAGAALSVPGIDGADKSGVFVLGTPEDAESIRAYIEANGCKKAIICGSGAAALETAENLARSMSVTVLEPAADILPGAFDSEISAYIKKQLQKASIRIINGVSARSVTGDGSASGVVTETGTIPADIVIFAPDKHTAPAFLDGSGIELVDGSIAVDEHMRTNIADIFAVGECTVVKDELTGSPAPIGAASGAIVRALTGDGSGKASVYGGSLGTRIIKLLPELDAGRTGLTEADAKKTGYDTISALCATDGTPKYYNGSSSLIIKLVADRGSRRLLGAQVIGSKSVDKMLDIAAMGIAMKAKLDDFETIDFAYAPPFSTAISPFAAACGVLINKLDGAMDSFTPAEYASGAAKGYKLIDVHPEAKVNGAKWIDLNSPEKGMAGIAKDEKLLIVCNRGRRAYLLQNRLKGMGYTNTKVLEGGMTFNQVKAERTGSALSADEIKRVKGLGCLRDKRYDDVFNVRVITRNGKITAAEQKAIADAAERFGSGEVAMTTRLTIEIQGVPYDNLDQLFAFLADAGLETGGTGSKVRPIVSCKGTTCQFGLIDTFGLSERIHEVFYKGYHDMTLPHKFKIAVGGCPNNCVKPDLNDLGIIGQRIPSVDLSKCRGCKVCQIEKKCPIKTAGLTDGRLYIDPEACNHCGRCIDQCPFGAVGEERTGYKVYIGGRWGKKTAMGRPLSRIFTSEDEVMELIDRAILLFRDKGLTGERFADTVARLGFDYVEDKLLNGSIDKAEIMKKSVKGGATC